MAFLHSKLVIVGDISPCNFVLRAEVQYSGDAADHSLSCCGVGEGNTACFCDCGSATLLREQDVMADAEEGADSTVPQVNGDKLQVAVGTPLFAAPELWHGGKASQRSDMWSVGACMFAIIFGFPPFAGADMASLKQKIEAARPIYPTIPEDHPEAAEYQRARSVISQLLCKDPLSRIDVVRAKAHPFFGT